MYINFSNCTLPHAKYFIVKYSFVVDVIVYTGLQL